MSTKINWANETWNPNTGCTKVGAGCENCYAIREALRMGGNPNPKIKSAYEGLAEMRQGKPAWTNIVRSLPERLEKPLRWRKPRVIFVDSMSDWMHPDITDAFRDQIMAVAALCPQHQFVFLTKRVKEAAEYLESNPTREIDLIARGWIDAGYSGHLAWPLPNVWIGASICNQADLDKHGSHLLRIAEMGWPVWVSAEPLIGSVDWKPLLGTHAHSPNSGTGLCMECGFEREDPCHGVQAIVFGGESGSGPGIRPMHPQWAQETRDQCLAAGVEPFFKQWGESIRVTHYSIKGTSHPTQADYLGDNGIVYTVPSEDITRLYHQSSDAMMLRVGTKAAGRELFGKTDDPRKLPWFKAVGANL